MLHNAHFGNDNQRAKKILKRQANIFEARRPYYTAVLQSNSPVIASTSFQR
jgi:hypothetical protein